MKARLVVLMSHAAGLGVALVGNYHFVYGTPIDGVQVLPKVSWSLSESIVNIDAVGGMPMFAVRAQYPLLVAAMAQRASTQGLEGDYSNVRSRIKIGMYAHEVREALGNPQEEKQIGHGFSNWVYRAPLKGQYVTVSLEDGMVINITD